MRVRRNDGGKTAADWHLLRTGREYVVYGISFRVLPHFLIYEPDELSFPFFVSSDAVDIVDSQLSQYWFFGPALRATDTFSARAPLISFEAMARDRQYYQALVDGDPVAVATWEEARRLVDSETHA